MIVDAALIPGRYRRKTRKVLPYTASNNTRVHAQRGETEREWERGREGEGDRERGEGVREREIDRERERETDGDERDFRRERLSIVEIMEKIEYYLEDGENIEIM
ncbi:hypothetical protein Tco_0000241 [Tanacetum coccineum]